MKKVVAVLLCVMMVLVGGMSVITGSFAGHNQLKGRETGGPTAAATGPVYNMDTNKSFTSIQAAIEDSNTTNGNTILVSLQDYHEEINVSKELNFLGGAILDGNISIPSGGGLHLKNFTLLFNNSVNGTHNLVVGRGGTLQILDEDNNTNTTADRSYIAPANDDGNHRFYIWIKPGSNFTMRNSEIKQCGYYPELQKYGLFVEANNSVVEGSEISEGFVGIYFHNSENSTAQNNYIHNTTRRTDIYAGCSGIFSRYAKNLSIVGNKIYYNQRYGLMLQYSHDIRLEKNEVCYNFGSGGGYGIYLATDTDVEVLNNTANHNQYINIQNYDTDNSLIQKNQIIANNADGFGISVRESNNCTVKENNISNPLWGVYVQSQCTAISILDNEIKRCTGDSASGPAGIKLSSSSLVINNTITNSDCGVFVYSTADNSHIYHNNLINNSVQAYDEGTAYWNASYPTGGNYWSDYNGTDIYSGSGQSEAGSDGIGDTPYTNISGGGGAQDNYPLMEPSYVIYDTTPPRVLSVTPEDTSTAQNSTVIEVIFSEPMDQSATESAFSIYPAASGTFSWNTNGDTLVFNPDSGLTGNTTYRVTIDSSVACDLAGNLLDGNGNGIHDATDTWVTMTDMPTARAAPAASAVGDKIYVIGGNNGSRLSTVEIYDTINDTWTAGTPMPTARSGMGSATLNGKIYVMGGWDGDSLFDTLEVYDAANDTWTTKAPMPTARRGLTAVSFNNRIYAMGGYNSSTLSVVEEYNPVNDTWETKAPLPTATTYGCAATVNGRIYVTGGSGGTVNQEYNPQTDTWTTCAHMPTDRTDLAGASVNGRFYAIGGADHSTYDETPKNEEFDASKNVWTTKSDMPTARYDLTATTVNGKIYAVGGGNSSYLAKNEVYTPNDDYSWYFAVKGGLDTNPPAFSGLESVENPGNGTALILSWSPANDSEGSLPITYNIYRSTSSGSQEFANPIASTTDTSYIDTGLTTGTTYYYVVRAQDSAGNEDGNLVEMSGTPVTLQSFDIPVHCGWNLISYPLSFGGDIEDVLNDDVVWDYAQWYNPADTGDHWKTHFVGRSKNDLNTIDNTMGIWLHVTDAGDGYINITGESCNSTAILLHAGWNLVSYPASDLTAMSRANLPSEVTKIAKYDSRATYLISEVTDWVGSNFVPGRGYWLYATADTTWTVNY